VTNCDYSTDEIVDFLKRKLIDNKVCPSSQLAKHIEVCNSCRRLFDNENMAHAFIDAHYLKAENKKMKLHPVDDTKCKPGEVYRFSYGIKESQYAFAIIDSEVETISGLSEQVVRIIPLFLNPFGEEVAENESTIEGRHNPLGLRILPETWNKRLISVPQLKNFCGILSPELYRKVCDMQTQKAEKLSLQVETFRKSEIYRAGFYSQELFNTLFAIDSEKTDKQTDFAQGVAFAFSGISRKFQTFIDFALPAGKKNLLAASSTLKNENTDRFYNKLCRLILENDLPLRIRRKKNVISLINLNNYEFALKVYFKNERTIEINSNECCLKIPSSFINRFLQEEINLFILIERP
jgi:predicted DNA-binding transcriptional regulator AlpA